MSRYDIVSNVFAIAQTANAERGKVSAEIVATFPAMFPENFPELSGEMQTLIVKDIGKTVKEVAETFTKDVTSTFRSQYSRFLTVISSPAKMDTFTAWREGDASETLSAAYASVKNEKAPVDWTTGKALETCIAHNVNLDELIALIREFQSVGAEMAEVA